MSLKILSNTAEGLVGYEGDGRLVGRAAASWEVSKDGLRYEFQLRHGRHWSDGPPLRAQDFVTGIRRTLRPDTGAKLGDLLASVQELRAISEDRLEIRLKRRVPHFLKVLTLPIAAPQRQDVLDAHGGKWPVVSPSASSYFIAERKADQYWMLKRHPEADSPGPQQIRLVFVGDEASALALFEQRKLEVLSRVPVLEQPRLAREGRLKIEPFLATYYLGFNVRKAPLDRAETRCALARLVEKDQILQVLGSGETRADSWIPPGIEGFAQGLQPGREGAKLPAGVKLRGAFDGNSRNVQVMEKVQSDFKRGGVDLELSSRDWKSHIAELRSDAPQVFRFGWLAAFPDPISHLQALTTGNANNLTGWSHSRYDSLVREIEGLDSGEERSRRIREAQEILVARECAVVPIYHYVQVHAVAPRVSGFRANGLGVVRFSELRISPDQ